MTLIGWSVARKFMLKHRFSQAPLKRWKYHIQNADWRNFPDDRSSFSSADWVNGKIVFNLSGNKYRVIATVLFEEKKVLIQQVLTHEEYDQSDWK